MPAILKMAAMRNFDVNGISFKRDVNALMWKKQYYERWISVTVITMKGSQIRNLKLCDRKIVFVFYSELNLFYSLFEEVKC